MCYIFQENNLTYVYAVKKNVTVSPQTHAYFDLNVVQCICLLKFIVKTI